MLGLDLNKYGDLKKRIVFTLLALIVYRIGSFIPVPGINPDILKEFAQQNLGGIFGMFDMFSGGALSRMTIFALNLMPYISASIITQLLTVVLPQLENLKKEGETGRRQLNKYTRFLTVIIASFQAYGICLTLQNFEASAVKAVYLDNYFLVIAIPSLVGGTLFLMWLGEQITSRGISNGTSLIIFSGIVANLPSSFIKSFELGRTGSISIGALLVIMAMIILTIIFVVYMERAQRRITIQYPKALASGRSQSVTTQHLPLKINSAGVIPPIFASSLLLLPVTIAGFASKSGPAWFSQLAVYLTHGHPIYIALYVILLSFFAFFYTAIVFNPQETAENLRKHGGFVPGIRPGAQTAEYLDYVLTRLTCVGAIYLAFLCILPEILIAKFSIPFYFGGTSILIVVGVTIDTATQVRSHIMTHQYQGLIKKIKGKKTT